MAILSDAIIAPLSTHWIWVSSESYQSAHSQRLSLVNDTHKLGEIMEGINLYINQSYSSDANVVKITADDAQTIGLNHTAVNQSSTSQSGPSALKIASDVSMTTALLVIMLGMGSTIKIQELVKHLKRPVGAAIGMLSQFVVLPAVTFGFAHALQLEPLAAIGMLVTGCCPGGSTSNMFTYWVDGDVPLSLTMTSVSTVLALGMMPLNIWLYSRSWTEETFGIPYLNIFKALAMTIVPAAVGIFIRWRWEKIAHYVIKVGSFAGAASVILVMTMVSLLYPFMYQSSWKIYIGAFFLPFIGFGFGYFVALLCCMKQVQARTVALETGIQNFPLCMTVISLTFPRDVLPKLALFPLLYGIFVLVNSCIFVVVYKVISNHCPKSLSLGHNDLVVKEDTNIENGKFLPIPTEDAKV